MSQQKVRIASWDISYDPATCLCLNEPSRDFFEEVFLLFGYYQKMLGGKER